MLIGHLLLLCWQCVLAVSAGDGYAERLELRPLQGNVVLASFAFSNSEYFPRILRKMMRGKRELHVRFSQGRWQEKSWGIPPKDGYMAGGTGVEVWAWVERDHGLQHWRSLTNQLAGLFCASINTLDETRAVCPLLSFHPLGNYSDLGDLQLYRGSLPREPVCTENLTPFLKLLPCKGIAGVASLLDGHKLFDSVWQSMAVDVWTECHDGQCSLRMTQQVDMAIGVERSLLLQHSAVPYSLPLDKLACDTEKVFESAEACYPRENARDLQWTLRDIFGKSIQGRCPVSRTSNTEGDVCLSMPKEHNVISDQENSLDNSAQEVTFEESDDFVRKCFAIKGDSTLNIGVDGADHASTIPVLRPPIDVHRSLSGYGSERGGMRVVISNIHSEAVNIVYLESLPWYLKPYLHTLTTTVSGVSKSHDVLITNIYYRPALDRERGTLLEMSLTIPPESTVVFAYEFEKAILRYTEYPPDANRGFDIAPAVVTIKGLGSLGGDIQLRTTSVLLSLPTPDFSMPYNVIILTSTVVALAFGSVFNLLVRNFVAVDEVQLSSIWKWKSLLSRFGRRRDNQ